MTKPTPSTPATKGSLTPPPERSSTKAAAPERSENGLCQNGASTPSDRPSGTDVHRTDGQGPKGGPCCRNCALWDADRDTPKGVGYCTSPRIDHHTAAHWRTGCELFEPRGEGSMHRSWGTRERCCSVCAHRTGEGDPERSPLRCGLTGTISQGMAVCDDFKPKGEGSADGQGPRMGSCAQCRLWGAHARLPDGSALCANIWSPFYCEAQRPGSGCEKFEAKPGEGSGEAQGALEQDRTCLFCVHYKRRDRAYRCTWRRGAFYGVATNSDHTCDDFNRKPAGEGSGEEELAGPPKERCHCCVYWYPDPTRYRRNRPGPAIGVCFRPSGAEAELTAPDFTCEHFLPPPPEPCCAQCFYWGPPAAMKLGQCNSIQAHPNGAEDTPADHHCEYFRPRDSIGSRGEAAAAPSRREPSPGPDPTAAGPVLAWFECRGCAHWRGNEIGGPQRCANRAAPLHTQNTSPLDGCAFFQPEPAR